MYSIPTMEKSPHHKSNTDFWISLFSWLDSFTSKNSTKQFNSNSEVKTLTLSAKDSKILIDAIDNPPEPSDRLLSVFE